MAKVCGVYKITNQIDGKFYIGSSSNVFSRWSKHRSDAKIEARYHCLLHEAMREYGVERFTFEVLEECETEKMIDREQFYLDALHPAYNICKTAGIDPEHLRRIAIENFNPEHQARMTELARTTNTGRKYPARHCENISKGNLRSEKRRVFSESRRGVKRDPEIGRKVSAAQKGKPRDYMRGRPNVNSTTGEYGITWLNDRDRYCVRFNQKKYGQFKTLEEALRRRDEVLLQIR